MVSGVLNYKSYLANLSNLFTFDDVTQAPVTVKNEITPVVSIIPAVYDNLAASGGIDVSSASGPQTYSATIYTTPDSSAFQNFYLTSFNITIISTSGAYGSDTYLTITVGGTAVKLIDFLGNANGINIPISLPRELLLDTNTQIVLTTVIKNTYGGSFPLKINSTITGRIESTALTGQPAVNYG